ncbi:MAG: hypothetical protein FWE03_00120 [Firmicutes bacterium]|nr:hypothetical protein [Bacillota bacterium]
MISRTWSEELWRRNSEKGTLEEEVDMIRGSLLAKTTMAYNFLVDNMQNTLRIENSPIHLISGEELIENNFKEECLRMMLINYSVVLIGMGRNDKVSLYNDPAFKDKPEVVEFYAKNKENIKQLKMLRDKIYSHVDPNLPTLLIMMPLEFIKELILFVTKTIGIERPKIRPR